MKIYAATIALALGLGACTSAEQAEVSAVATPVATIAATVVPPAALTTIQNTCKAAGPLLATGAAASNATVSSTAVQGAAYCSDLAAASPGTVPATTNANTASWLPGVISAVEEAAQIAGVVLPVVAAL